MISQGLEFAPGTTDECKKLVTSLFTQEELFVAYRRARIQCSNGDLVIRISEHDPSVFEIEPRIAYIKRIRDSHGQLNVPGKSKDVPIFMRRMSAESAHKVVQLPAEGDALWLIVVRGPQDVPVTCVIFAVPYETAAVAAN